MNDEVLPLSAVGRDDLALAGGKGANLGALVAAGLRVPTGFVVTTGAYARALATASLPDRAAPGDGSDLRAAISGLVLPEGLEDAFRSALTTLGEGPLAVRSSATAEDLPGAAFAGQQDTFLDVEGADAVLDALRACWASLWTERAIAYRERIGIPHEEVGIAVVVQRMVPADVAGVMFTADPVTGERERVVVTAVRGLGEALVSGATTPDTVAVVDGRVVERREGDAPTGLAEATLVELAVLAREVEGLFGVPQDIEWALASGEAWLLQARPMTALPPAPLPLNRVQRLTGPQLLEMLPERPLPMDVSGWILPGLGRMVQRMLGEIPGLRLSFTDVLPERDGVVERLVPYSPEPTAALLTAPARNLPRIRRFRPARWREDPRYARFVAEVSRLHALDLGAVEWRPLLDVHAEAMAALDLVTDLRVDYLPRAGIDLLRVRVLALALGRWSPQLTRGGRTRTEDTNAALGSLADLAREDPALVAALGSEDPVGAVAQGPHEDFRERLAEVLDEYGHREAVSPLLLSEPTWGAAPEVVLAMVRVLVGASAGEPDADAADRAQRHLLDHPLLRRTGWQARAEEVLRAARAGIVLREDTHFEATRVMPVTRRVVDEVGRRLADTGVLRRPEDVWHLRWEEVRDIPDPAAATPDDAERLRRTVADRSARRAELASVPLIAPGAFAGGRAIPDDAVLVGTPASAGRATGPVRVILAPSDFGRLRTGDVLVCPYTNPSWTPLFQRATAVVADTGGTGSHAAIVAREYAVPAVMGTGVGTTTLVDGQVVTVDGDLGVVTAAGA